MDNSKLSKIIIGLVAVIILFAIMLLSRGCSESARLELIGNETITIYQNERYKEPGYNIVDTDHPENFYISIDGYVNINKVGAYFINYHLYNQKDREVSTAKRQVIVLRDKLSNVYMYLKGEDEEYFFVNDYIDHGIEVYDGSKDISNDVTVVSNVEADKVGEYEVRYQIYNNTDVKEAIRRVNIVDYEIDKEIDLKNLLIDLRIKVDDYSYTLLPDRTKSYSRNVTYDFNSVGEYEFDIYLKSESHKKYVVNIETIDKEGPKGTCSLLHEKNKTTITMNVTDEAGISKFSYNGLDFYNNITVINSLTTNITVRAYDKYDNYSDIKCHGEYGTAFRNLVVDESARVQGRTGYIVCGSSFAKENQELKMLAESYGLKSRGAVAAAALYLASYDKDMYYSWGGKSAAIGFDPNWGCWVSNSDKRCTSKSSDGAKCRLGLDCGGLIRWSYLQAGFSNDILRHDDIIKFKWGNFNPREHTYNFNSSNMVYANQLKPGDLVHRTGHIGIVIGVDSEYVQVAEMLGPLFVNKIEKRTGRAMTKQKGFTEFVLMDEFFNMYGINK